MLTLRLDTRRMRDRNRRMTARAPVAALQSSAVVASVVGKMIITLSPRDTGRYVRGWQWAHNMIPFAAPVAVSSLSPSKYSRKNRSRLLKQARHWTMVREEWDRRITIIERRDGHERSPYYRKQKRTHARVMEIERRAWETFRLIDESPAARTAIVIGGKAGRNPIRLGALSRANVNPAPKGDARVLRLNGRTVIQVTNLEPHANIVGARSGVVRSATMLARAQGQVAARGHYIRVLRGGSDSPRAG